MTPSLEGSPTKAKEAPSLHEVRLAPLDTNPVFQCFGEKTFCKNADFIFVDKHNHFDEADINCILSLLHVCESFKISELSSWNPLVTSLTMTFNLPLLYFS